jgi:RNA polymerase sigma factor (sigma-70 family)
MQQPKLTVSLLQNRQALLGFIFALTRDSVAAEEIFQEVALAILGEAAAGRDIEPFMPWAREVARRRTAEHYRRSSRRGLQPLSESMEQLVSRSFEENEEDPGRGALRLRQLRDCVGRLPDRAREAVERRYQGRMDPEGIARAMALRVPSVHVLLSRARSLLADCVKARLSGLEAS